MKKVVTIMALSLAALILFLLPAGVTRAQRLCPADRPCITELYRQGSTLVIGWDGHENFTHYNLRWGRPGVAVTQREVAGGSRGGFRINNIQEGARYTVSVQGCNRRPLGRSSCTPWYDDSFDTRPANRPVPGPAPVVAPGTCRSGFVWREARSQDLVCVTPDTRARAAAENRLAASRRNPGGGPYGPNTCRPGFVWRDAFPGDVVCVTPEARAQAAEDNRLAASRRVR